MTIRFSVLSEKLPSALFAFCRPEFVWRVSCGGTIRLWVFKLCIFLASKRKRNPEPNDLFVFIVHNSELLLGESWRFNVISQAELFDGDFAFFLEGFGEWRWAGHAIKISIALIHARQ